MNKEALEEVCRLAAEGCDEWSDMIDKLQAIQGKVGKAFAQMIEFMCQQGLIGRAHPFSLEELKSYYRYSHTERSPADGVCGYAETNDGKIYAVIVVKSINGMFVAARNIHMTDNKSFLFGENTYGTEWRFWNHIPSEEDIKETKWHGKVA